MKITLETTLDVVAPETSSQSFEACFISEEHTPDGQRATISRLMREHGIWLGDYSLTFLRGLYREAEREIGGLSDLRIHSYNAFVRDRQRRSRQGLILGCENNNIARVANSIISGKALERSINQRGYERLLREYNVKTGEFSEYTRLRGARVFVAHLVKKGIVLASDAKTCPEQNTIFQAAYKALCRQLGKECAAKRKYAGRNGH